MKEVLQKNVNLILKVFLNMSLKVKNGIDKLDLGNGNTAKTDKEKSQVLNLFYLLFFKMRH